MSWRDDALRAWSDHQAAEQEAAEQAAAATVEYLLRFADTLHVRPSNGTARYGEPPPEVHGEVVVMRLVTEPTEPLVELRTTVDAAARPAVHAWIGRVWDRNPPVWQDRGVVETRADLGRALDLQWKPADPTAEAPTREESTGDMLETILRAIVREVVHEEIDGRLGSGPP